ncbi:MAG: DUF1559 domain-containing protein [Planctomycetaceae bacterium]|nr:DUF1559 domain-containing protein [Planctomycetaceae bacterium]
MIAKELENYWVEYPILGTNSGRKVADFKGALRVSQCTFSRGVNGSGYLHHSNVSHWEPRDNMSWLSDGTSIPFSLKKPAMLAHSTLKNQDIPNFNNRNLKSLQYNQVLIGEKHIPAYALNSDTQIHKRWDGGYGGVFPLEQVHNVGRLICGDRAPAFAMGPNDQVLPTDTAPYQSGGYSGRYGFGSSHTGIVNFLMGDGSVHALSTTTQHNLMFNLARVNDGNPVTIP